MTATAPALAVERETVTGEHLIRTISLTVRPMTREAFAPYGEIINQPGNVALDLDGGSASVVAQTVEARPMKFDFIGRHQRSEQFFAPLGGTKSILAVAP